MTTDEKQILNKVYGKYTITVSLTKTVKANNEKEAFKKAFDEFMKVGVNPNCFDVYINRERY